MKLLFISVISLFSFGCSAKDNVLSLIENKNRPTKSFESRSCGKINQVQEFYETKTEMLKLKKVRIAIIDTGISLNSQLDKKIVKINGFKSNEFGYELTGKNVSFQPFDDNGHGTHIAGIITQISPNAEIIPIKYYTKDMSGDETLNLMKKSIELAISQDVDIINISAGGYGALNKEKEILQKAEEKGIVIITAAGNEGNTFKELNDAAYYPASYNLSNMISVESHNERFEVSEFSNIAKEFTIAALGEHILSYGNTECLKKLTGTSQATAIVTGYVAVLKGLYPEMTPNQIKEKIIKSSSKKDTFNKKNISNGVLNPKNLLD